MSSALRFSHTCIRKRIVKPYLWPICFVIILTVLSNNGLALLLSECADINYVGNAADYIVEGTVKKVESKLVKDEYGFNGQSIFTYNDLTIEKYVKGNPLKENRVQIVTRGGTAGGISQWVEDEPTFYEGTEVRVYLRETNGNFSLVCAEYGVEEILPPDFMAGTPVEVWNRTFGGAGLNKVYSVQQTSDGGFILAGEAGVSGTQETHAWLIKTDANGEEMWNRTYGKKGSRTAKSVMQTSDGGYLFISNNMLTKTDENGNYLLGKEFSGIGNSVINSISQSEDGNYILASDTMLIKVDNRGNILWKKTIEKLTDGWINSVQQTKDDGYILAGNRVKGGAEDVWLYKIDSAGNEQWNRTFGGKGSDYAYYTQQTADGGYIITGQTSSYGSGGFDAWLIKTDAKGIEQWNKTFGGTFQDSTYFVQQTPDGGFILAGSRSYRNYGYEAMLIKTDGSGNLQWIRPFRGFGFGSVYSVNMTEDGGFALAGYTSLYMAANSYAWLIKAGGGTNGGANAPMEKTNETFSEIPTSGLTPAKSATEEVPEKKAAGFETFPVIIALSAVIVFGRKKVKI